MGEATVAIVHAPLDDASATAFTGARTRHFSDYLLSPPNVRQGGEVAGVAAAGPDPCQAPEVLLCRGQKGPGGVPVGRGCGGDLHVQEESEGVGEQVPLAAVDLIARAEAA